MIEMNKAIQPLTEVLKSADMKILIVEDDLLTLESVSEFLRAQSLEVKTAPTIDRALECLSNWTPDLIITDVGLEDRDAFAMLDLLAQSDRTAKIPIIAVSGYILGNAQRRRFGGYLTKPINLQSLLQLVRKVASVSQV